MVSWFFGNSFNHSGKIDSMRCNKLLKMNVKEFRKVDMKH